MPGQFLAQVEEAIKAIDKASTASDRWLFLAAIALIMIGSGMAVRYLVRVLEKKDEKYDDLATKIYAEHAKLTAEVTVALRENTAMIEAVEKRRMEQREEFTDIIKANNVLLEQFWKRIEQ